ncbi:MAG: BON domain-containing protein, partial [Proteobacteria bacterium]|nr:BON domain-containing protein [Pseudomonadota bacterium]
MCQPKKWWWGLLPLALLFALMNSLNIGPIEGDLARRSADVFTQSGIPWAKATLSGRDAVLSGEAPNPETRRLAVDAAGRTWGVRQVVDSTTVSPELKPYTVSATREGNKVTLAGYVPGDAVRAALVSGAKAAFPNAEVVDQLKEARGAPAPYAPAMAFGLAQLGKLTSGVASLSDHAFSLSGRAINFPGFDAVTAALKTLPGGATLAKAEILPPVVSPFAFSATKANDQVTLAGYLPSESARAPLLEAAKAVAARVVDQTRVAGGLPDSVNFGAASGFFLGHLAKLKSGVASLSNDGLSLSGEAPDVSIYEAVTGALKGALPGGLKLVQEKITGPVASPYIWSANRAAGALTLGGTVPSEAVRTGVLDAAKRLFPSDRIVDQMKLALGAPSGFVDAVTGTLGQLAKLGTGAVGTITDKAIRITGETMDKSLPDAIKAALTGLPAGFAFDGSGIRLIAPPPPPPAPIASPNLPKVDAVIPPAPAPVVVAPPPVSIAPPDLPKVDAVIPPAPAPVVVAPAPTVVDLCQIKFRDILGKEQIYFNVASARIRADSRPVLEALAAAVRACPTMTIEIQGHTDSD